MIANQSSMLILQETRIDLVGSLVVYEMVDNLARHVVMNGGDSAYVDLLLLGFEIILNGPVIVLCRIQRMVGWVVARRVNLF
ncbi:putative homeobox-leucine zipper protein GLAB [Helianthus debilis subsp. tardiflorus]